MTKMTDKGADKEFSRYAVTLSLTAVNIAIALLIGFAADSVAGSAARVDARSAVDIARLGVIVALLPIAILAKAILEYFKFKRFGSIKKSEPSKRTALNDKLTYELRTAPLELAARQYSYCQTSAQIEKTTLKERFMKSLSEMFKVFLLSAVTVFGCYLAYKGNIATGITMALGIYLLIKT